MLLTLIIFLRIIIFIFVIILSPYELPFKLLLKEFLSFG